MEALGQFTIYFVAMAVLILASAFFSCCEAALFYLQAEDRRILAAGNKSQRLAAHLLEKPDRLLSAILLWNLVINISYFALSSVISIRLSEQGYQATSVLVALGSLLTIIICSEMVPKNIGVLQPRLIASCISVPLMAATKIVSPILPLLLLLNRVSYRVLFPNFKTEEYLNLGDLENAISLSSKDPSVIQREQTILHNIISLTDLRVEELMRPRVVYQSFRPPVHLADLKGKIPAGGYVLITEPDGEEISGAVSLADLASLPETHLEHHAQEAIYLPWCASVAAALTKMTEHKTEIGAVINEFGETIGILTANDIWETIFLEQTSRSKRLHATRSVLELGENQWQVLGLTTLRRIEQKFKITLPEVKSLTVEGLLQEKLQRLPKPGDHVSWSQFEFTVIKTPEHGPLVAKLRIALTKINDKEPNE